MTEGPEEDQERPMRSYDAGARWAKERMTQERPADAAALADVTQHDIVVVRGEYGHVERVLGALDLPFVGDEPDDLLRVDLRPEQLLVADFPGKLPESLLPRVEAFVGGGGSLFTTDWACGTSSSRGTIRSGGSRARAIPCGCSTRAGSRC